MNSKQSNETDGITWISAQNLIRLRHHATRLPLDKGKVHARQGGAYLSPFRGRGMEYDESRSYLPGDDIRNMDWRVTARTGEAYTKVFREERERPVIIWLDLNPSMFFATRGCYKSVAASRAAALVAWSAAGHNDRVGALLFAGDRHIEMRPARGKNAVLNFIGSICKHSAWHDENTSQNKNMSAAMARLRKVARPGSLIFLLSDFREDNGDVISEATRSHLISTARHNDIVLINVYDPVEATLPPAGRYRVSDGGQEIELNTTSNALRTAYAHRFAAHRHTLQELCRKHRMHMVSLSTQDDVLSALQHGLGIPSTQDTQFRSAR